MGARATAACLAVFVAVALFTSCGRTPARTEAAGGSRADDGSVVLEGNGLPEGTMILQTPSLEVLRAGEGRSSLVSGRLWAEDLSPNGRSLLATAGHSEASGVYRNTAVVAVDVWTAERRTLVEAAANEFLGQPRWSHSADAIAFTSAVADPDAATTHPGAALEARQVVCVFSPATRSRSCLDSVPGAAAFAWSPDGVAIDVVASGCAGVTRWHPAAGGTEHLVRTGGAELRAALDERGWGGEPCLGTELEWSTSGRYFAVWTPGGPAVFDADGDFVMLGPPPRGNGMEFAWSPSEDVLAYLPGFSVEGLEAGDDIVVWLIDPRPGGEAPVRVKMPFASASTVAWSPSGRWIAVAGCASGSADSIRVVPVRALDAAPLDIALGDEVPEPLRDWGP